MTNSSDLIMYLALDELKKAARIKGMNHELLEHLNNSINWLFRYSEKYNIILPERENLYKVQERSNDMINDIMKEIMLDQPQGNTDNNYRRGNSTP